MEYKDGVALLREVGVQMGSEDDLTTENERILGGIVKAKVCISPTRYSELFYNGDSSLVSHRFLHSWQIPIIGSPVLHDARPWQQSKTLRWSRRGGTFFCLPLDIFEQLRYVYAWWRDSLRCTTYSRYWSSSHLSALSISCLSLDAQLLSERVKHHKINVDQIKSYIDAFRYGCPPHGGGGIGLERVLMLYLGLGNVRKTSMFPRDPKRVTP